MDWLRGTGGGKREGGKVLEREITSGKRKEEREIKEGLEERRRRC